MVHQHTLMAIRNYFAFGNSVANSYELVQSHLYIFH